MTSVKIVRDADIDLFDVVRRSPFAEVPEANANLTSYMISSYEVWVGYVEDEVACICGLIPPSIMSDRAYLWLLTTDLVQDHKFLFVRHSQRWLEDIMKRYEMVFGHVQNSNWQARAWLEWLGAKFGPSNGSERTFQIVRKG